MSSVLSGKSQFFRTGKKSPFCASRRRKVKPSVDKFACIFCGKEFNRKRGLQDHDNINCPLYETHIRGHAKDGAKRQGIH